MGILVIVLWVTTSLASETPWHQLSFGHSPGVGWAATSSKGNTDEGLGIDGFKVQTNNLSVNYAYRLNHRWQVGAAVGIVSDEQEMKLDDGEVETEVRQTHLFAFVTHNFHDEIQNAFFLTALFGRQHFEHASNDKRSSNEIDLEYDITSYGGSFGKRFTLKHWQRLHVAYAPAVSYFHGKGGGDLGHDGLEKLRTWRVDVLRFDVLF